MVPSPVTLRRALLRWWDRNRRAFPWREPGFSAYGMLVAEMLLRQTRAPDVARVLPRLLAFYPRPAALARARGARLPGLLRELGLQHQRRAALVAAARHLTHAHGGAIPRELDALRAVPHVGEYAAHAVACFAHGQRVPVVDVNVLRILSRVRGRPQPSDLRRAPWVWDDARALVGAARHARDVNYALLDLGAMVCTNRAPACAACPLRPSCRYGREGG